MPKTQKKAKKRKSAKRKPAGAAVKGTATFWTEEKKEEFYEALERLGGNKQAAAKKVGAARSSVYDRMNEDPAFRDRVKVAVDKGRKERGEELVDVLYERAKDDKHPKSTTAAIFLVKGYLPDMFRDRTIGIRGVPGEPLEVKRTATESFLEKHKGKAGGGKK